MYVETIKPWTYEETLIDGVDLAVLVVLKRVSMIPIEGNTEPLTGSPHDYLLDSNWEELFDLNHMVLEWFR